MLSKGKGEQVLDKIIIDLLPYSLTEKIETYKLRSVPQIPNLQPHGFLKVLRIPPPSYLLDGIFCEIYCQRQPFLNTLTALQF